MYFKKRQNTWQILPFEALLLPPGTLYYRHA